MKNLEVLDAESKRGSTLPESMDAGVTGHCMPAEKLEAWIHPHCVLWSMVVERFRHERKYSELVVDINRRSCGGEEEVCGSAI